ncbi:MAG: RidA family protein [Parachlamydiaceae bacterium]|nr:RidA family protein [Parachlamydiaceae bacterium]
MPHQIKKIETEKAPRAIGPYSQATSSNGFIFVSGQLPIDPITNELVKGNIQTLTNRVLDNLEAILHASGCGFNDVVRVDVFLTDLSKDFADMNAEYAKRFNSSVPPARQTIQVSALPKGASIEMSCIAVKGK